MTDFPALIRTLAEGGVDFIIVGGAPGTIARGPNFTLITEFGAIDR